MKFRLLWRDSSEGQLLRFVLMPVSFQLSFLGSLMQTSQPAVSFICPIIGLISPQSPISTTSTVFESTFRLELLYTLPYEVCSFRKRIGALWLMACSASRQNLWVMTKGLEVGTIASFTLSNTPNLEAEYLVMVVVGTVPLVLCCLTLLAWNHCLIGMGERWLGSQ